MKKILIAMDLIVAVFGAAVTFVAIYQTEQGYQQYMMMIAGTYIFCDNMVACINR